MRFNSPFPIMEPREKCGEAIEEELLAISASNTLKAKSKTVVRMFGSFTGRDCICWNLVSSGPQGFDRGRVPKRERCMTYLHNEATVAPD